MLTTKDFRIIKKRSCINFYFTFGFVIFFPIVILSPVILIRFGLLHSDRLGHFSANTELFLCEQLKKKKGKR